MLDELKWFVLKKKLCYVFKMSYKAWIVLNSSIKFIIKPLEIFLIVSIGLLYADIYKMSVMTVGYCQY